jgi:hypothetical protein
LINYQWVYFEDLQVKNTSKGGDLQVKNTSKGGNNILNNFRGCYVFEKLGKSFSDFVVKQGQIINAINPIINTINPFFMPGDNQTRESVVEDYG